MTGKFQSTLIGIANSTVSRASTRQQDLSLERHVGWYSGVILVLLGGYLLFDRAFAHLHIPGVRLFLAEPVLALGLVLIASSAVGRQLIKFSTPIRAVLGFMAWGALLLIFHVFGHGLDAIQDSALWYYGLFAIVVAAVVRTLPDALDRLIPLYAGGLAAFAVVGWVRLSMYQGEGATVPDTLVPWTSHRPGNIAVHAAIGFAFVVLIVGPWLAERFERSTAIAITTVTAVALLVLWVGAGTQNRGGLIAGFLVIVGVPLVSRSFGPAIAILSLVLVVILGVLYVTEASINLGNDERDLSVRQIIDNIVSVRVGDDSGRIDFWSPVVDDILSQEHFLTGLGFGENLGDRYGFAFGEDDPEADPLRNVHNSQLNVLARMGVIGVGFWVAVWGFWYFHLFRARARLRMVDSPRRAAYLGWAMLAAFAILVNSFFDGTLEGPQVGVWLWAIFGLGAGLAMDANLREWQRRRTGAGDIAREGGETNPLELSLRQLKRASKRANRR